MEFIVYRLNQELSNQFITHKQNILKLMKRYIEEDSSKNVSETISFVGTNSFNLVWEDVCSVVMDDLIKEKFTALVSPTENHKSLAQLPISIFWTTNYDRLIEKALESNMKIPNIKTKDEHLRGTNRNFDAIVYKLHGDVGLPEDAVITRSDYEEFGYSKRKLFREVLEGDLLTKTFLFLGFSFEDPNFNYVITRLRVLLDEKTQGSITV